MAKEAGEIATKFLKKPHDLEYEKTFLPFCLLSKKRYVGMLYEEDPHKCKRKSMGIVLKRRDNAPIVKDVYGGIIDILMKDKDINKSIDFLDKMLKNIVDEKIGMDKLIISKKLPFEFSEIFFTYLEKSPMFKITIEKKANKVPVILAKAKRFSLEIKFSVLMLSLKALIISFEFSPARIIIKTAKPV